LGVKGHTANKDGRNRMGRSSFGGEEWEKESKGNWGGGHCERQNRGRKEKNPVKKEQV